MKITILTYGSRGDVQPFIPLSLGLIAKGHSVSLAAPSRFKDLVEEHNIKFVPLAGEPEDLSRRLNDAGYNFIKLTRELMDHAIEIGADVYFQTQEASREADLIVHTFSHTVGAHTLARELNIPDIHIQTFPMFSPTGDYPNVTLPEVGIAPLNRLSHVISQKITWWGSRFGFEQVRRRAGLPKRKLFSPFEDDPHRPPTPILCAWSPSLIPPSSDWPARVHVTGWYFLDPDREYSPPPELKKFLASGLPPVCVSFGSMMHRETREIDRVVRESLSLTDNRGIILSGWSQVENQSSDKLLCLDAAPHDWLLPRCKMIVHHGGAGTTSAGLRGGIPNIVVPFMADQPFWGKRVHAVGAGPKPIPVKQLSTRKLTRAILEAESEAYRECARAIGQRIRNENGVRQAVSYIETYSKEFHTLQL
jgi:sterol 3beta-glucosyltransferase